jgi:hypothetical protein|nr:MAG TPA: hypothetical protein [Caudoviricetes sp.]
MTTTPRPLPSVRSYTDVKNLAGTFKPATAPRRRIPTVTRHEQALTRHERAIVNLRAVLAFERRRRQTIEEALDMVKKLAYGSVTACIVLSVGFLLQLAGAR